MEPIIEELQRLIEQHQWQDAFQRAIDCAQQSQMAGIQRYQDLDSLLEILNGLATWAPSVDGDPRHAFDTPIQFYYILDQEPLKSLQSLTRPAARAEPLTPLSAWMVKFAQVYGSYLDTPASAARIDTFKAMVDWDEYMPPPSGYRTFNQFFARHVKPGTRPIAAIGDSGVIVSPADSTFVGRWEISSNSEISVEPQLDLKGFRWSIHQLLEGSAFADRFRDGLFMHSYLGISDYHRWHCPVQGQVLEARVIQGQVSMDVHTKTEVVDGKSEVIADIVDTTGFQFVQTRGLIVLDSPIGLVACLPVGMALVSSVVITAEVGSTLHKGEELGYFQFGGSDFVMVFERSSNVQLICQPNVHYKQGSWIGNAYPGA
ncbi:MAG TPA: phosphatidylserine decarboxylase [Anaerolineales bacterium]